jgi:hypothetical protein
LRSRNYFFRSGSGSDFQKVPAPEPAPATALELPVFTDFMLKRIFFMFLMKKIDLIHMLDPIQYEFRFFQNTLADPEPEPKLRYSGSSSGSGQKFRLRPAPVPAPQPCLQYVCYSEDVDFEVVLN